jgi:hypothetical protein
MLIRRLSYLVTTGPNCTAAGLQKRRKVHDCERFFVAAAGARRVVTAAAASARAAPVARAFRQSFDGPEAKARERL